DEALWLDAGLALSHGDPKRVVGAYLTKVEEGEGQLLAETTAKAVEDADREAQTVAGEQAAPERPADPTSNMYQATEGRWGSREIEITEVALLDGTGQQTYVFHSGDQMSIRLKLTASRPNEDFVFGIGVFNADGVCCYGTN